MIRNIYCERCAGNVEPFDDVDRSAGWRQRLVAQKVKRPAEHFILVDGKRFDLPSLLCDGCNVPIMDGDQATLVTAWRTAVEPPAWEHEYAL